MNRTTVTFLSLMAVGMGGLALSLSVFRNSPAWVSETWSETQPWERSPRPPSLAPIQQVYNLQDQTLSIQQQTVAGVPIEGSYFKVVRRGGQVVWIKTRYLPAERLPNALSVERELSRIHGVQARSVAESGARELGCTLRKATKPVLRWSRGRFRAVFVRSCETPTGEMFEVTFNNHGAIIGHEIAGSHFSWSSARIHLFPRGPKLSELEATDVAISAQPYYLLTPSVEVTSDTGLKIRDVRDLEAVQTEDPSFDMVQAYYYSSTALRWIEDRLKIKVDPLRVRTHVGHPEKSNVAFYFAREIRLGQGDGISFAKIPWDPSIVVHEVMHGVIEALTGLTFKGEPGSMQEALADSLTALHLNSPLMGAAAYKGGAYQRNLENEMKFTDRNGKMYHDSLVLSGTIWAIKESINDNTAMDLIAFLLARGTPDMNFNDVQQHIRSWLQACTLGERCDRVGNLLSHRGWLQ
jgi:hypothetical protein